MAAGARNSESFNIVHPEENLDEFPPTLLQLDPPQHGRYRLRPA